MTTEELKIRQLTNQHLLDKTKRISAVRHLCGMQAQFMSNAIHAMKIRCSDFDEDTAGEGLVKNWTIRGTLHLFAEDDLPLFYGFCGEDLYRCRDWTIKTFWNQRPDWGLTPERQGELSEMILDALRRRAHTREELKEICREKGMTQAEEESMFHPWGGGIRELCERGFIHGTASEEKVYLLSPELEPMTKDAAGLELARRYFTYMGPATIHDAMYFFRVTASQVKKWLNRLPVISVECQGKTYYYIENDVSYDREIPRCLFLAGFDPLMLGYEKKENLYLPQEHMRKIFNLAGIVMPAVLLDGQVAGKWKMKDGRVTVEVFERIDPGRERDLRDAAETLWGRKLKKLVIG